MAAAVVAAGAGVAGCGSNNTADTNPVTVTKTQTVTINPTGSTPSPDTGTATTASTTTATGTTPTATGTTTSSTSTSTSTRTGSSGGSGLSGSHCTASGLTPVSRSTNGAAGTIAWEIALKNTGNADCATEGYPGVQFIDSRGSTVGQPATRSTTWAGGTIQPGPIELKPGESAYFYIDVDDAAGGGSGCTGVSALQIYAPDDTTAMKLTASPEIQYCPKLTVTPLTASAG